MTEFRFDHVHLRSTDPEAAARFYATMFGAEEAGRVATPLRIIMRLGGINLFIEQVPQDTPAPPPPPFLGVEHLGLVVADCDAAAAELKAKGARFTLEPTSPRPGIRIAFVEAPDGARVEILSRAAG